ncbi:MAG: hypothetical protein ACMXX6_00710 [Candidatus Woesearchaeota archaeon]
MAPDFDELMKIQRMAASRLQKETKLDSKFKLFEIIQSISQTKNIHIEQIIIEAKENGFLEDETLNIIDDLINDGYLERPQEGFVKVSI